MIFIFICFSRSFIRALIPFKNWIYFHHEFLLVFLKLIDFPSVCVCQSVRRKNKPKMSNVCFLITQEAYQAVTFWLSVRVVFVVYRLITNNTDMEMVSKGSRGIAAFFLFWDFTQMSTFPPKNSTIFIMKYILICALIGDYLI